MHETYISGESVVTNCLWVAAVTLVAAGWGMVLLLPGHDPTTHGLWATGIMFSAMAATAQCRLVGVRICAVVRSTSELRSDKRLERIR